MGLAVRADRSMATGFQTRQFSNFAIRGRQEENFQEQGIPDQGLRLDMPGAGNFDTVSIQSREMMDDDSFVRVLSRSTVESLRSEVSAARATELRQQVQSGQYVPVSSRIAERMLGYRERG